MDTIIMAGQIKSTHFFFANPFGDLFNTNSISPIEILCTVFLFLSGNFIFLKVQK
jgi:hypothetical protein